MVSHSPHQPGGSNLVRDPLYKLEMAWVALYKIAALDKHIHNQPYKIRTCVCPINIIKPSNTTKLGHPCDMKNYIYSKLTSYKIGANRNGLIMFFFFSKIWCPKSVFGVPLFSIDYVVPNIISG